AIDVDEVLQQITDTTRALLTADAASVALWRPDGQIEVRVASGLDPEVIAAVPRLPMSADNPVLARLRAGQPVLVADAQTMSGMQTFLLRPQTVSFYSFPLVVEQQTIGLLNLSFNQPYQMQTNTITMLTSLANQAALALARAQLYNDVARSALEMSSLYRIGLATSSSLQIDEVIRHIYRQVQELLAPYTFFIALTEGDSDELRFEIVAEHGQLLPLRGSPLGPDSLSAWVVQHRRP